MNLGDRLLQMVDRLLLKTHNVKIWVSLGRKSKKKMQVWTMGTRQDGSGRASPFWAYSLCGYVQRGEPSCTLTIAPRASYSGPLTNECPTLINSNGFSDDRMLELRQKPRSTFSSNYFILLYRICVWTNRRSQLSSTFMYFKAKGIEHGENLKSIKINRWTI